MPNHITNLLTIKGNKQKVQEILKCIKNDEIGLGSIDFNKITPMPPWVWNEGALGSDTEAQYGSENCWRQWSIDNWGTKWNAYGFEADTLKDFDGNTIEFNTAWSGVTDLIQKLSMMYRDVNLEYNWADEDIGYNVGQMEFNDGQILSSFIPEGGSKKAYELAAEIQGMDLKEYGYFYNESTGSYEFNDEDEIISDTPETEQESSMNLSL